MFKAQFYFLFLLSLAFNAKAQTLRPTTQGTFSNHNMMIDWSLGETLISTHQVGDSLYLTQGFNQPLIICEPCDESIEEQIIIDANTNSIALSISPNPVANLLRFETTMTLDGQGYIAIIDNSGSVNRLQSITTKSSGLSSMSIDISSYLPGSYYLKIFNGQYSEIAQFIKYE